MRVALAVVMPLLLVAVVASAQGSAPGERRVFNRIATFEVVRNLPPERDRARKSVAEIVTAAAEGTLLIYVDGEQNGLGFVDITDPAAPRPAGFLALEGETTSVVAHGPRAYVVSDTSPAKDRPSGFVSTIDVASRRILGRCELGGQPDATAVTHDGQVPRDRDRERAR